MYKQLIITLLAIILINQIDSLVSASTLIDNFYHGKSGVLACARKGALPRNKEQCDARTRPNRARPPVYSTLVEIHYLLKIYLMILSDNSL